MAAGRYVAREVANSYTLIHRLRGEREIERQQRETEAETENNADQETE